MNKNGNTYAISALKRRRAEIDGEIQACELQLRSLNEALCHLDATLCLFDPDYDPKEIRARRRYDRARLFGKGKLTRLILDALRKAERPLSTPEVIAAIAVELNFGSDVPVGVKARVRAGLRYLRKARGCIVKEGERATALWGLK
jgi:hypothetical protein